MILVGSSHLTAADRPAPCEWLEWVGGPAGRWVRVIGYW